MGPALLDGFSRRREPALEDCRHDVKLDGLGDVVVHARGEASLAVARHRVGRHRDHGRVAAADLASAQAAFARGDNKTARQLAARAKERFPVGSPGWVRADDIVAFNENLSQNPLRK